MVEASQRYQYAAKRVPDGYQGAHKKVFDQLKIHLLLNLSRCKRKMKDYQEAVNCANEVIAHNPQCYEAFHARAKANHAAGNFEEAMHDLTEAVRVAPQNRELHKIMLDLKEEIKRKTLKVDRSEDSKINISSSDEGSTMI